MKVHVHVASVLIISYHRIGDAIVCDTLTVHEKGGFARAILPN